MKICWLLLVSLIFLHGCNNSEQTATEYILQVKSNKQSLPKFIVNKPENIKAPYVVANLRSPFVTDMYKKEPVVDALVAEIPEDLPDFNRKTGLLESLSLDSLAMVGTLKKPGVIWGLIKDADDIIHTVKIGTYIGENYGEILEITDKQIKIQEKVKDPQGKWISRMTTLTLFDKNLEQQKKSLQSEKASNNIELTN